MNTRRYGFGGKIFDEKNKEVGPPLYVPARSSLAVSIVCDFPLTGTSDLQLYRSMMPVAGNPPVCLLPRYTYELALEDVDGNLFDKDGWIEFAAEDQSICAGHLIMRGNGSRMGKPWALIHHASLIGFEEVRFAVKPLLPMAGNLSFPSSLRHPCVQDTSPRQIDGSGAEERRAIALEPALDLCSMAAVVRAENVALNERGRRGLPGRGCDIQSAQPARA